MDKRCSPQLPAVDESPKTPRKVNESPRPLSKAVAILTYLDDSEQLGVEFG